MQYVNVKVPSSVAFLDSADDVMALITSLCGEGCARLDQGSCGYSSYGPYCEGDLIFRGTDGLAYSLAYDFVVVGDGMSQVFRVGIDRQPGWDGADEYVW